MQLGTLYYAIRLKSHSYHALKQPLRCTYYVPRAVLAELFSLRHDSLPRRDRCSADPLYKLGTVGGNRPFGPAALVFLSNFDRRSSGSLRRNYTSHRGARNTWSIGAPHILKRTP